MANNPATEVQVFAGVDVSARKFSGAVRFASLDREEVQTFSNSAAGHQALLGQLLRGKGRARVCLEASGNYSLDLALTLHAHRRVEALGVTPTQEKNRQHLLQASRALSPFLPTAG